MLKEPGEGSISLTCDSLIFSAVSIVTASDKSTLHLGLSVILFNLQNTHQFRDAWLAQSVTHVTLDLGGGVISVPPLSVELT